MCELISINFGDNFDIKPRSVISHAESKPFLASLADDTCDIRILLTARKPGSKSVLAMFVPIIMIR